MKRCMAKTAHHKSLKSIWLARHARDSDCWWIWSCKSAQTETPSNTSCFCFLWKWCNCSAETQLASPGSSWGHWVAFGGWEWPAVRLDCDTQPQPITWPMAVKFQFLINRLSGFQQLCTVFMQLCYFGRNGSLENMQESSLLLTAGKLHS